LPAGSVRYVCERTFPCKITDAPAYSYLLGLYLGDGAISRYRQTYGLRITLDQAYPEIIADARAAVQLVAPDARVTVRDVRGARCVQVACHWAPWPEAFPQHGPGRKHERRIALAPWQQQIVDMWPWAFLRGLLHSDGCRTINRFSVRLPSGRVQQYAYPRWFFSNRSEDVLGLFRATCDRVGVGWTRSSGRNVSVSRRPSVALLEEHVGAKR
jgi:hypothetical protein